MCESEFPTAKIKLCGIYIDNLYRTAGAIILRISHGYEVKEKNDPFVTLADEATVQFSLSTAPGFLVNIVPARE